MDLATLIGLVGGVVIIGTAIVVGASPGVFLNAPSVLIVVLGSLSVVLAKFSFSQYFGAIKAASRAFSFKLPDTQSLIEELIDIANVARKQGVVNYSGLKPPSFGSLRGFRLLSFLTNNLLRQRR